MNTRFAILAPVAFLLTLPAFADDRADPSRLTVERIYAKHEFAGDHLSARWVQGIPGYLTWEPSSDPSGGRDLVEHDPESGHTHVLISASLFIPPGGSHPLNVEDYTFSKDLSRLLIFTESRRVWRRNTRGDYWVLDRSSRHLTKLGGDAPASSLMFAKLSPDSLMAAYVRDNALFVEDLRNHQIRRVSDAPEPGIINGTFDWVYEEELNLRDGFRWSPDSQFLAYWQLDTRDEPDFVLVNNTDALYPTLRTFKYPKVGERNASARVGIVHVQGGNTNWIALPGDPREHYLAYTEWLEHPSGNLILQQLDRLQQTARVFLASKNTNETHAILTEHDDAWIDHQQEILTINQDRQFLWLSERDGWRHVYRAGFDDRPTELVTPGDFDVIRILAVDPDRNALYFLASPDNPTRRYLYQVQLDGTGLKRLTPDDQPGTHDYDISPDAQWAIHRFSTADTPPTVDLVRLPDHDSVRVLVDNAALRKKLDALKLPPTEFFRVDIGDNVQLDAWCLLPPDFDPAKTYPLLVYVYGEPAGQTVVDSWGGESQLWHRMLTQDGFVVMSFDNRGTAAPRGRAWRKSIYRQVGILAPQDQAKAVRQVLADRPYLDPSRVGVWGWSGGGSMSLNAIFKFPDLYATAIAVAPVPNQRYYDTIYQERYMGLPGDNVEGYTQGSPITHAKGLKGHLLLIHGTGDDNCHYQTVETLINELIRLNKPFSMMAYPNRSHSIHEGTNTTLHLRSLMTQFLRNNLR